MVAVRTYICRFAKEIVWIKVKIESQRKINVDVIVCTIPGVW